MAEPNTLRVFWNVTPCRLIYTDVSKKRSAFMFRVKNPTSSWADILAWVAPKTISQSTRRHIPEDLKVRLHRYVDVTSGTVPLLFVVGMKKAVA